MKSAKASLVVFTLIVLVLTSTLLSTQTTAVLASESTNDWPMFHQNPARTSVGSGDPILPTLLWNNTIKEDVNSVAVTNGAVYASCDLGYLSAFNAINGTLLWSYSTDSSLIGTPAIANGIVYIRTFIDEFLAIDATNGVLLWDYQAFKDQGDGDGYKTDSSAVVVNGIVYFGSNNGNVYALNASSGERIWMYSTRRGVPSSPAIVEGVLYVGLMDGNVYALNAATGELIWSFNAIHTEIYSHPLPFVSDPVVAGGVVYIAFDKGFYALNMHNGNLLWSLMATDYRSEYSTVISPIVSGGRVFMCARNGTFYALDATSGDLVWFSAGGQFTSGPAAVGEVIYCGGRDGNIYALNAATGLRLWNLTIVPNAEWGISSDPALAYGVLYVGGPGGVYAIGKPEANAPNPPPANPTPIPSSSIIQAIIIALIASCTILLFATVASPTRTKETNKRLTLRITTKAAIAGLLLSLIVGLFSNSLLMSYALPYGRLISGIVVFAVNNFAVFAAFYLIGLKADNLEIKKVTGVLLMSTLSGFLIGGIIAGSLFSYFYEPVNFLAFAVSTVVPSLGFPEILFYLSFLYLFFVGMCALILGSQKRKSKLPEQGSLKAKSEEKKP